MMSPVPTPLMGFSSLKPQGQEWTHRPIFNYLPGQDQDPLPNFLLAGIKFSILPLSKLKNGLD